ncbi:MAG: DEAD/DEAH box helicase [Alicyclobacillaceae bacterium]|nr:DEAD/DEAH box helicase [Alicyclobacillaceae bacterium]
MKNYLPYQQHTMTLAKERLDRERACLIAADPGLGKTAMALGIAKDRGYQKVLVVCPASVLGVWPMELSDWWPEAPVTVLTGPLKRRAAQLAEIPRGIVVTNYEALVPLEEALIAWHPDAIIADECHRLKAWQGKTAESAAVIARVCRVERIGLSGTPTPNGPIDALGLYRFLNPKIFGTSITTFRQNFCIMNRYIPKKIDGYKNMAEFKARFHRLAIVIEKAAVQKDLPEKITKVIPVTLPARVRKIYDDLQDNLMAELEDGKTVTTPDALSRLLRLSQLTGGFLEGEPLHTAKLDVLSGRLEDHLADPSKKVVVFARFRPEIDAIAHRVDQLGYGFSVIDGRTAIEERADIVRAFQEDKAVRVIIGQLQAMAEGVTLTAAHTMLYYSLDYSEARHAQSKDRIHRIGQSETCLYEYLIATDTVDQAVMRCLDKKRDLSREILSLRKQGELSQKP